MWQGQRSLPFQLSSNKFTFGQVTETQTAQPFNEPFEVGVKIRKTYPHQVLQIEISKPYEDVFMSESRNQKAESAKVNSKDYICSTKQG